MFTTSVRAEPLVNRLLISILFLLPLDASAQTLRVVPGAPDPGVPVIFLHGFNAKPRPEWSQTLPHLARGRPVTLEMFAGESDQLPSGAVSPHALFNVGYYRERSGSPRFYTNQVGFPSIGGCPTPRTDRHAASYRISYARQLDRIVENVLRATGARQVDLVAYSLGGLVARAYTRWLSLRGPGGSSRVRRLLTVCTPNNGINSFEATLVSLIHNGTRQHVDQGEAAEMNRQCTYWGGRSFVDRLNTGWDAFCRQQGIRYGAAYGYGWAIQSSPAVRNVLVPLVYWLARGFARSVLVHPTPGFDLQAALREATGTGDGVVRTASSWLDPRRFPGITFNAPHFGLHGRAATPSLSNRDSLWREALVRRFLLQARSGGRLRVSNPAIRPIDAGGQATWLELDADVTSGQPLSAQVLLTSPGGRLLQGHETLLQPGANRVFIDPAGIQGDLWAHVRVYGLDREIVLVQRRIRMNRLGRPRVAAPSVQIGALSVGASGYSIPLTTGSNSQVSVSLGQGRGWSPYQQASRLAIPNLLAGEYELRVRVRSRANAAGRWVEAARPAAARLILDPQGRARLIR